MVINDFSYNRQIFPNYRAVTAKVKKFLIKFLDPSSRRKVEITMAEIPKDVDQAEGKLENAPLEQAQDSASKKKISPKVLLGCIIGLALLLFLGGGWFLYKHFSAPQEEEKKISQAEEGKDTLPLVNCFVAIPEAVVNLRSQKPKGNILRTTLVLQIYNREDEQKIKEFTPIILDQVLSYLRDQSVNDLEGPGLERMRQAILLRINNIVRPIKVYRVILKDFIIQ